MATDKKYGGGMRRTNGTETYIGKRTITKSDGSKLVEEDIRMFEGDTVHFAATDAQEFSMGAQSFMKTVLGIGFGASPQVRHDTPRQIEAKQEDRNVFQFLLTGPKRRA